MIYLCDAIMGSGKSQSAIAYMNSHPQRKFLYITPYVDEAWRIVKECPELQFVVPMDKVPKFGYTKCGHTNHLLCTGRNVATTHQSFKFYTAETIDSIRENGYTLIIDEAINVLDRCKFHHEDIELCLRSGYMVDAGDHYEWSGKEYSGKVLHSLVRLLRSRHLYKAEIEKTNGYSYYWSLPIDLLQAFSDIYILTYLFEGTGLYHFLKLHNAEYQRIGISRTEDGGYEFDRDGTYVPGYVANLKNMIHICDHAKLNAIGEKRTALSKNWYGSHIEGVELLKKHTSNYFRHIMSEHPAEVRLWATFKNFNGVIRGKGYANRHISLNSRATNDYRGRRVLAYLVNLYLNVDYRNFMNFMGIETDEDGYALSTMIQWIWRSAIRDGEEIWLYVPSKRMRKLLTDWIDAVSSGRNPLASEGGEAA